MSAIVLLAACASNAQLPAPSSLRVVDPARDVIIVPQDVCPKFGGWICKTQDAQAAEEMALLEEQQKYRLLVAEAQGAQFVAEVQRDQAIDAANDAAWWSRWSPLLIALGVVVGGAAGAALGVAFGGK